MDENKLLATYSRDIALHGGILDEKEQGKLAKSIVSNRIISGIYSKSLRDKTLTEETRKRLRLENQEIIDQIYSDREALTVSNLPFVISRALKYARYNGVDGNSTLLNLIQDGSIGIYEKATKMYDPYHSSNSKFISYACSWVDNYITRGISNKSNTIRRPVHTIDLENKVKKFTNKFILENPRNPSSEEISNGTQIKLEKVKEIQNSWPLTNTVSLDHKEATEDDTLLDTISYDSIGEMDGDLNFDKKKVINELFVNARLTGREIQIMSYRFGLETGISRSLREVKDELGLSRERVRQIEEKSLQKLNRAAKRLNLNFEDIF